MAQVIWFRAWTGNNMNCSAEGLKVHWQEKDHVSISVHLPQPLILNSAVPQWDIAVPKCSHLKCRPSVGPRDVVYAKSDPLWSQRLIVTKRFLVTKEIPTYSHPQACFLSGPVVTPRFEFSCCLQAKGPLLQNVVQLNMRSLWNLLIWFALICYPFINLVKKLESRSSICDLPGQLFSDVENVCFPDRQLM